MRDGRGQVDVGAAGAAGVGGGDLHAALVADDAGVIAAEVFAAGAFVVALGAEDCLVVEGAALIAPFGIGVDARGFEQAVGFCADFVAVRGEVMVGDVGGKDGLQSLTQSASV